MRVFYRFFLGSSRCGTVLGLILPYCDIRMPELHTRTGLHYVGGSTVVCADMLAVTVPSHGLYMFIPGTSTMSLHRADTY